MFMGGVDQECGQGTVGMAGLCSVLPATLAGKNSRLSDLTPVLQTYQKASSFVHVSRLMLAGASAGLSDGISTVVSSNGPV